MYTELPSVFTGSAVSTVSSVSGLYSVSACVLSSVSVSVLCPVCLLHLLPSMSDLNQELKLWWRLKKRVLEAAVPRIALGSNEPWNIMSRMQFA
jgi:hypothetical protein